jgi:nucleotide-binding universal stress UspA family protein
MAMLARILVPLDGSYLARMALDFVTHAAAPESEITLFRSVVLPEVPIFGTSPLVVIASEDDPTLESERDDAKYYLAQIADELRKKGFKPQIRVGIGDPAHAIVQAANELNVDVIIMSSHGRTGIGRWLFGSVTSQVLNMTTRPVLVIPCREVQQQFEHESSEVNIG